MRIAFKLLVLVVLVVVALRCIFKKRSLSRHLLCVLDTVNKRCKSTSSCVRGFTNEQYGVAVVEICGILSPAR